MKYVLLVSDEIKENTFLVYDENTKNGIIIDPGCTVEQIESVIKENGINIKYILLTHCHFDHIESLIPLREITGAKIVTGENGNKNLGNPEINLTKMGLGYEIKDISSDIILKDGEIFELDGLKIKCIYTPGHTDCSVCYMCGNDLFAGDTLFLRSCGRWDFPTGDFDVLEKSIKEKLYTMDDDVIVHPGHGADTKIGYEKKFNMVIKL